MLSRRHSLMMLGAFGLGGAGMTGCQGQAAPSASKTYSQLTPLKSLVRFPLGVAAMTGQFDDPEWDSLTRLHFDQLTPEWEMKMEYMLLNDGRLRFEAPDRLIAFAKQNGQNVFGHTLIWYAQDNPYFQALRSNPKRFVTAYEDYIFDVATHFKGRLSGWDVVNEPILDDGSGLRSCLWRDLLGDDYIDRAYRVVRAVEPTLPLALNDYSLEYSPTKRRQFLKLVDGMLKRGTPLDVLGSQTHLSTEQAPGAITAALKDLAATGLKIHISEIDISLNGSVFSQFDLSAQRERQYRLLSELTEAFVALPSAQQFGMTVWGLRDKDSWLTRTKNDAFTDEPLWFDNKGRPKRLIEAFVSAL